MVKFAQGDHRAALDLAQGAYRVNVAPDGTSPETAIRAAAALGDADAVDRCPPRHRGIPRTGLGRHPPRGRGDAGRPRRSPAGEPWPASSTRSADGRTSGLRSRPHSPQLNLVTVLGTTDREARAAGEEARVLFERLGALPLLDRLAAATTDASALAAERWSIGRHQAVASEVRVSGTPVRLRVPSIAIRDLSGASHCADGYTISGISPPSGIGHSQKRAARRQWVGSGFGTATRPRCDECPITDSTDELLAQRRLGAELERRDLDIRGDRVGAARRTAEVHARA